MASKNEDSELTSLQQFLLLAVVSIVLFLIFFIYSLFNQNPEPTIDFSSCETRFDSTSCPEPDYGQSIEESKKYPDATPYDSYVD